MDADKDMAAGMDNERQPIPNKPAAITASGSCRCSGIDDTLLQRISRKSPVGAGMSNNDERFGTLGQLIKAGKGGMTAGKWSRLCHPDF